MTTTKTENNEERSWLEMRRAKCAEPNRIQVQDGNDPHAEIAWTGLPGKCITAAWASEVALASHGAQTYFIWYQHPVIAKRRWFLET